MTKRALGLVVLWSLLGWAADPKPAPKRETVCGWVDNPTPQNWEITDSRRTWVISVQGDYAADGELPDFTETNPSVYWKETNGHYGHGCACLSAEVDPERSRIVSYRNVKKLPLAKCKANKSLPQKGR